MIKLLIGIMVLLCLTGSVMAVSYCPDGPNYCANLVSYINSDCQRDIELSCDVNCEDAALIAGACSGGYTGNFDGQGYIITGLKIHTSSSEAALFARVGNSTCIQGVDCGKVKNLGLVDVDVDSTSNNCGALIGFFHKGVARECYSTGNVICRYDGGGLVGQLYQGLQK